MESDRSNPQLKILVTNDDGIEAEGLKALVDAVAAFGDVTVVAPRDVRSECSHSVITTRAIDCIQVRPHWYAVDGTPVDCVRAALATLELRPDLVFSGINSGANLGTDVLMSGTVAAAREAALRGFRSVAISQYRHPLVTLDWQCSSRRARQALEYALQQPLPANYLWNINLPAVSPDRVNIPMVECRIDPQPLPLGTVVGKDEYRYLVDYHGRPRTPKHDVDLCFAGNITLTPLAVLFESCLPSRQNHRDQAR